MAYDAQRFNVTSTAPVSLTPTPAANEDVTVCAYNGAILLGPAGAGNQRFRLEPRQGPITFAGKAIANELFAIAAQAGFTAQVDVLRQPNA